ncbi:MAG: BTAD domain-containing putative transcriptional regulator [Actinoplanes sp.]
MIRFVVATRTTVLVLAWLIGVPALLTATTGPPLPDRWPTSTQLAVWLREPLDPAYSALYARSIAWLFWAVLAAATLTAITTSVRRLRLSHIAAHLPAPMQGLAAAVLGTAAITTIAAPPAVAQTPAVTTPAVDTHRTGMPTPDAATHKAVPAGTGTRPAIIAEPKAATAPRHASIRDHPATHLPGSARGVHHVKAGDNLWDIAKNKLGDPSRWREIYTLNRRHEQANGYALTDPDEIHIGWVLALPTYDATPEHRPSKGPANGSVSKPGASAPGPHTSTTVPQPAATTPEAATPSAPPSLAAPVSPTVSATPSPGASATVTPGQDRPPAGEIAAPGDGRESADDGQAGISLPSDGWVSLGLAALIAAVASLLRLQRRRRARLTFPIPARTGPQPTPLPDALSPVDVVGARHQPAAPAVPAPIGLDTTGNEVSLFDLPGPGLALTGDGAEPAARAVLAAVLTTGATHSAETRPVVVTTTEILTRLLPTGAPLIGLDPDGSSYDGERLIVLADATAATTHAEEEMIMRRRLLDTFDLDTVTALNDRTDHAETQPPYVLLIEATTRHAARLRAVGAHRPALHLHPVILGSLDGLPTVETAADGTTRSEAAGLARLSTLAAGDLAAILTMLTDATPRPEPGHDLDRNPSDPATAGHEAPTEQAEPVPAQPREAPGPVRLRVLGPVLLETPAGPVATGMRSGSYTVLASLAVHPGGRTLDQLAADLHPDTDPGTAGKRIRTDISTTRRVLRAATGNPEAMFVVYDPATGRYHLDAELITVDLWQMLTAIQAANTTDNDTHALALLREAVGLYGGDFADGADQTWITDYATTYRHQILSVLARIAEILEPDHPDQAVAALERALELDPVNEELYQRVMRIHGRAGRPDAVRRTLRRLEERLADLGDAEPSQATRRVADRQLRPATAASGGPR